MFSLLLIKSIGFGSTWFICEGLRSYPGSPTGGIANANTSLFVEGLSVEFSSATLFLHVLNVEAYAKGVPYVSYWLGTLDDDYSARADSDLESECSSTGPVYRAARSKTRGHAAVNT